MMPRDLIEEHRMALEGLRDAKRNYARTIAEARRRVNLGLEWLVEARRRVVQAEAAARAAGIETRGNRPTCPSSHGRD